MPKNLRIVTPNLIVSDSIGRRSKHHPNGQYRNNKIHTSKYTWLTFLPKNLFEQFYRFANLYFLLIQILNWLPGIFRRLDLLDDLFFMILIFFFFVFFCFFFLDRNGGVCSRSSINAIDFCSIGDCDQRSL